MKGLLFILLLVGTVFCCQSYGQEALVATNQLSIKPNRCVALRQGQMCYQHLTIKWSAPHEGRYCLRFENESTPLRCWEKAVRGTLVYDFQSDQSKTLQLVESATDKVLMDTEITLAWVYKSRSRSKASWRLF